MKKRLFTLIELLTVISIISILASIIFPSLGNARKKTIAATCVNNLKQIGYANYMYVEDNDDLYLNQYYYYDATAYYNSNALNITKYGNYQPSLDSLYTNEKRLYIDPVTYENSKAESFRDNYAMNKHLHNVNINQIDASTTMTHTDTNYEWFQDNQGQRVDVRHQFKLNQLWADSHVNTQNWEHLYNNLQWLKFTLTSPATFGKKFTFRD